MEDQELIGKTLKEANQVVESYESIRVNELDGKHMAGTCDFNPDRINVVIDDGVITRINGRG